MEFLKATQTRCETGQIASFGLKPAQNEEDFQQGSAQNEEDFQQGFVVEKGFTLIVSVIGLLIYVLIAKTAGEAFFFSFRIQR